MQKCFTRSDKLDGNSRMRHVGWKIVSCVKPYDICCKELDGTRSYSYEVISSFLEKYDIIHAHYFENKNNNHLTI